MHGTDLVYGATTSDLLIEESKGRGDGTVPTMAIVSAMGGMTVTSICHATHAVCDDWY